MMPVAAPQPQAASTWQTSKAPLAFTKTLLTVRAPQQRRQRQQPTPQQRPSGKSRAGSAAAEPWFPMSGIARRHGRSAAGARLQPHCPAANGLAGPSSRRAVVAQALPLPSPDTIFGAGTGVVLCMYALMSFTPRAKLVGAGGARACS
jgi:hypothetical protein